MQLSPNEDNLAPLAFLAWQVHVYGERPAAVREACAQLGLPLHEFAWTSSLQRAGLVRGGICLVRADGCLALVDREGGAESLHRFARQWFVAT